MKVEFERLEKIMYDRGSVPSHVVGFLIAQRQAMLFHQSLYSEERQLKASEGDLIPLALAHMVVFSVRAMETFFRDCFISICCYNPEFGLAAAANIKGPLNLADVATLLKEPHRFNDLLASNKNFQNLDGVSDSFVPFFKKSLFEYFDSKDYQVLMYEDSPRKIKFRMPELFPNWRAELFELFDLRNEIVHNAHHPLPTDQEKIVRAVGVTLYLGQLMGVDIGNQIEVGSLLVKAPVGDYLLLSVLPEIIAQPIEERAKLVTLAKEIQGAMGHVGPFIFGPRQLLQTDFRTDNQTYLPYKPGRKIFHVVNKVDGDRFEVETLYSVENTGEGDSTPMPAGSVS